MTAPRPASVVALETLNVSIVRAALERAGLPADTDLPTAPRAYLDAYAAVMCERRKEVFAAIEAAGRDASGMSRHFVEDMAAAYARATAPRVATDGAGYQNTASAPVVEPVASVVGEAAPAPAPVAMMAQPVQQAQSVVPLGGRYVPLGDGGVEWVPDAPAMVPQPCQQQQARARGRTPQPARGERRYVTVRDTETGDVHRVLTSVARVGVAVVIFTPSNRHRQGAHNGMLITHDDIRKAWVFNDEAEARRMLSRNRTPGERVIRAELVSDPAVA